jgi:exosortase
MANGEGTTLTAATDDGAPRQTARPGASDWLYAAALVAVFWPAIAAMSEVWGRVDYYSHGYLVPLVALWAASGQRHRLPTLPAHRDGRGWIGLGAALGLYAVGLGAGLVWLQGLSFVAAVAALVLALRGPLWIRALTFPVAYLLFMVPIPEPWLAPLIVQLQLFVSAAGVAVLQAAGYALFRDGNVIHLPGGDSLFVAEACSGITSVVTLVPLAVFLAYFTERTLPRRCILVAAVVPLAMLGNLLRVVVTVVAAERYGAEAAASGFFHESAGLLTYVLGCLALLGVGALMRRLVPERGAHEPA